MSAEFKLVFCVILIAVLTSESKSFETQFFGDYLTDLEYENQNLCSTKHCMLDNDMLVYAAGQNSSIRPCDDFKTFAKGEFLKHRVINDRYYSIGFDKNVLERFKEQQRKLLLKPVVEGDPKIFKVLKSYYKKCIDSGKQNG